MLDDHMIFREGVAALIDMEPDMKVVGNSASISEFKENILKEAVDIILIDLTLGSEYGVDAVNWLKDKSSPIKVLIFSMHKEETHIKAVLDSGANGFILKDVDTQEIMKAIRSIYNGDEFYSQEIMKGIIAQATKSSNLKSGKISRDLSEREIQVLKLIAQEKSNHEISELLFISKRTVDTHRRNIIQKIGAKNTASIVRYAIKNKFITL